MTDLTACSGIRATPEIKKFLRKTLRCEKVMFVSQEQRDVLRAVVLGKQRTPLVVVLPASGEKSLSSVAPARMDDPSMTIVVVPHLSYRHNQSNSQKQLNLEA
jgi:superfamily II DNA helicase RecQ